MVIPYTDIEGAEKNRKMLAEMRAREAGLSVPDAPTSAAGPEERQAFIDSHKAEIIADYKQLGRKLTRKKWKFTETEWDLITRKRWADAVKPVIEANKKKRRRRAAPPVRKLDLARLKRKYCPRLAELEAEEESLTVAGSLMRVAVNLGPGRSDCPAISQRRDR